MKQISIISGKGGTGKTSITAALAALSRNAVIADCDVDAADLHLLLRPETLKEEPFPGSNKVQIDAEECIRCGLCKALCRFDAVQLRDHVYSVKEFACEACDLCRRACPVDAIYIKPSTAGRTYVGLTSFGEMVHARLAPGEELSGKLVAQVRDEAKALAKEKGREMILIDGPPGVGCSTIASITGVDVVVVVTEPAMSGLHDLQRVVELARKFDAAPMVLINKADINSEVCTLLEDYCRDENIEVLGKLPWDERFVKAMIEGKTVVEYAADSSLSRQLKEIAARLSRHE